MHSRFLSVPDCVSILDMPIGRLDEPSCINRIMASIEAGQGGWVVTSNTDILRRYVRDGCFRRLVAGASLFVADGMPLIWASMLQGSPLPARVAGSNLVSTLSAAAADGGRSIFLLGGDPGTAEATGAVLRARHPSLRVVGVLCPPLGFEHDPQQVAAIGQALECARPDIVFVALGSPKQEWLIDQLRHRLPASWWLGIGISFSFLAGRVKRAPAWIQHAGLEWLHRLVQEPKRLARRYLVQGIPFAVYMLSRSLVVRVRNSIAWRG